MKLRSATTTKISASPPQVLRGFLHNGSFLCHDLTWLVDLGYSSWRSYLSLIRPYYFVKFKFKNLVGYGFCLAPRSNSAPMVSLAALFIHKYKDLIEAHRDLIFACQINSEQVALVALKNKMLVPLIGDQLIQLSTLADALQNLATLYLIETVFHNWTAADLTNLPLKQLNLTFNHLTLDNPNYDPEQLNSEQLLSNLLSNKRLRNQARLIPTWRNRYLQIPLAIIIFLMTLSIILYYVTIPPKTTKLIITQQIAPAALASIDMLELCIVQHAELFIDQPLLRLVNLVCSKPGVVFQYTYHDLESGQLQQILGPDINIQADLVSKSIPNLPTAITEPKQNDASRLKLPQAKELLQSQNMQLEIKGNNYTIHGCNNPLSLNKLVDLGSISLIHGMNDPKTQKLKWTIDGQIKP